MTEPHEAPAAAPPAPDSRPVVNFLQPQSLAEAIEAASILARSTMVPEAYRDKPDDILVAGQMGAELGIPWMQALQNINVIGGRPAVWGDLALVLLRRHPQFEDIEETYDEATRTATCAVLRRDRPQPIVRTFSWADACAAGLHEKGTYQKYRRRMLQMRARGFAMRDAIPEAFKSLALAEEMIDVTPPREERVKEFQQARAGRELKRGLSALELLVTGQVEAVTGPKVESEHDEGSPGWWRDAIRQAATPADLQKVGFELRAVDPQLAEDLRELYRERAEELREALRAAEVA